MRKIIVPLRVLLGFMVLLGLIYPIFVVVLGNFIFPDQAQGSLLKFQGRVVGSELIAQEFTLPKYFHSRFSAVDYNAANSGASNYAVSNRRLYDRTKKRIVKIRLENNIAAGRPLPADMVLSSASGLDPHISLDNALLQLPRVVKNRKLSEAKIKNLIYQNIDPDFFGIWGQCGVNVLKLNLALDKSEDKLNGQ